MTEEDEVREAQQWVAIYKDLIEKGLASLCVVEKGLASLRDRCAKDADASRLASPHNKGCIGVPSKQRIKQLEDELARLHGEIRYSLSNLPTDCITRVRSIAISITQLCDASTEEEVAEVPQPKTEELKGSAEKSVDKELAELRAEVCTELPAEQRIKQLEDELVELRSQIRSLQSSMSLDQIARVLPR